MANAIGNGVENIGNMDVYIRTVPALKASTDESVAEPVPTSGSPYATQSDLENCAGLIIGSPTHFGNMAAPLKYFFDQTTTIWLEGKLAGKPAGCFTSTGSLHGGMESTTLSMMLPLLHHGMIYVGLPYTEQNLLTTESGGTPYGPSHLAGPQANRALDSIEKTLCTNYGKRIAIIAQKLAR